MKKTLSLFVLLCASAFLVCSGETVKKQERKVEMVLIPAPSLSNSILGDKTEQWVGIYLPPGYEQSEKSYPVVYFLAGYGSDVNGIIGFLGFPGILDKLIGNNTVRDMIVVIISGNNIFRGSFYVNSPVSGNWEDFIAVDVVSYIDKHYRTLPKTESRGICGHSMGGFGALNIAMNRPDVFCAVYALSPGLFDATGLSDSDVLKSKKNVEGLIRIQEQLKDMLPEMYPKTLKKILMKLGDFGSDSFSLRFTLGYGTAFAPSIEPNSPLYKLPYSMKDGELIQNKENLKVWDNGFGGIEDKVKKNKKNLLKLKRIVVDYGKADEYQWIPKGCEYFGKIMKANKIPCEVLKYEGNHDSQVTSRLQGQVFPFFNKTLAFE